MSFGQAFNSFDGKLTGYLVIRLLNEVQELWLAPISNGERK